MTSLLSNKPVENMTRNELADEIATEVGVDEEEYSTGQKITFNKQALKMILQSVKGNKTAEGDTE